MTFLFFDGLDEVAVRFPVESSLSSSERSITDSLSSSEKESPELLETDSFCSSTSSSMKSTRLPALSSSSSSSSFGAALMWTVPERKGKNSNRPPSSPSATSTNCSSLTISLTRFSSLSFVHATRYGDTPAVHFDIESKNSHPNRTVFWDIMRIMMSFSVSMENLFFRFLILSVTDSHCTYCSKLSSEQISTISLLTRDDNFSIISFPSTFCFFKMYMISSNYPLSRMLHTPYSPILGDSGHYLHIVQHFRTVCGNELSELLKL